MIRLVKTKSTYNYSLSEQLIESTLDGSLLGFITGYPNVDGICVSFKKNSLSQLKKPLIGKDQSSPSVD